VIRIGDEPDARDQAHTAFDALRDLTLAREREAVVRQTCCRRVVEPHSPIRADLDLRPEVSAGLVASIASASQRVNRPRTRARSLLLPHRLAAIS
jgi:hypothetical protein